MAFSMWQNRLLLIALYFSCESWLQTDIEWYYILRATFVELSNSLETICLKRFVVYIILNYLEFLCHSNVLDNIPISEVYFALIFLCSHCSYTVNHSVNTQQKETSLETCEIAVLENGFLAKTFIGMVTL